MKFCLLAAGIGFLAGQNAIHPLHRRDGTKVIQGLGSNIQWTLRCAAKPATCEKVEHTLPLMARFLENAVRLEPIAIYLDYFSFCKSPRGCSKAHGMCRVLQLIPVKENHQTFLFPQALFKQTRRNEAPALAPFDMTIDINADFAFHFLTDYPRKINRRQISFIDALVHEVNHGLGFLTAVNSYTPA